MQVDIDGMLQAYGMTSELPDTWQNSGFSSALATLDAGDETGGGLVDDLLDSLTASAAVAADEPDPLGSGHTIMSLLAQRGIVPANAAQRAVYMPSSTSFDPRRFLADCHGGDSLAELQHGLARLRATMQQKDEGRRETLDADYGGYVTSKRRLDAVMARLDAVGVSRGTRFATQRLASQLEAALGQLAVRARPIDQTAAQRARLLRARSALDKYRARLEIPQKLAALAEADEHDRFVREFRQGTEQLATWLTSPDASERELGRLVGQGARRVHQDYLVRLRAELMRTSADGSYAPLLSRLADLGVDGNPAVEWMEHNIRRFATEIDDVFDTLEATAARNYAEAVESGRQLDLATHLKRLVANAAPSATPGTPLDAAELSDVLDAAPVDSEGAAAQWAQVLDLVERLRHTLKRCTVFFREFLSVSETSAASAGSWQLAPAEAERVSMQCRELIETSSERLVASLTAPFERSAALPIAAAHARSGGGSSGEDGESEDPIDSVSFIPLNANALSVAQNLGKIAEVLAVMGTQIAELAPSSQASAALGRAMDTVRQQFVRALCACWTRDAQLLGDSQDWSKLDARSTPRRVKRASRIDDTPEVPSVGSAAPPASDSAAAFPDYFAAFHGVILERLRLLVDAGRPAGTPPSTELTQYIAHVFGVALSLSIRSVETALVASTRHATLADSQAAELRAALLPAALGQDAKLLLTISHLETLRRAGLEQVYRHADSVFDVDVAALRRETTPEVERLSQQLFEIYIRKKRSKLSQVVHQEFQRLVPAWAEEREVRRVSNYVYESLMVLVETHAQFMDSCAELTRRAILELFQHLLATMLQLLRGLDVLGRFGTLQNIADLEFMRWALSQLPEAGELQQQVFRAIRQISTDDEVWALSEGPRVAVRGVLNEAVRQSHFAFLAFKSLEKP